MVEVLRMKLRPGRFRRCRPAGDAPEDQALGYVARSLINRAPDGPELSGGIKPRDGLPFRRKNFSLHGALRATLRVKERGIEFNRVVRSLLGERQRQVGRSTRRETAL